MIDEKELKEEIVHEEQIKYLRMFYPHKKININGYGLTNYDAVFNRRDLFGLIKTDKIVCGFCSEKISDCISWLAVFHNPPESSKPVELLFFCHTSIKKCAALWGVRLKKQNKDGGV